MSTQILNLTPHEINIGTASIKPFGVVARVYVESISDGEFTTASGVTIPISHSYYGDVENLPNPMPNTIYIVSALVASRVPTRSDVFYPCCMVRDTQGRVIGCYNYLHDVIDGKIKPTKMTEAKAETKPLTLQSATTLAAPPIAPTIPLTKTNTVSCSATKTCAAYKPVPQSPAKP